MSITWRAIHAMPYRQVHCKQGGGHEAPEDLNGVPLDDGTLLVQLEGEGQNHAAKESAKDVARAQSTQVGAGATHPGGRVFDNKYRTEIGA
jgi:hypothetical protein